MTNSPTYDKQLTLNDYWQQIGGLVMLPGTNRASDRFVRASSISTPSRRQVISGSGSRVFSVMRNVSVPLGITTPDQPNISSTRWRTVADQKNKVYYFESTLSRISFGRFQELGLQGRYTYQETNAHKRRDLRRKHRQRFQGQQAVTVLVRDLKGRYQHPCRMLSTGFVLAAR